MPESNLAPARAALPKEWAPFIDEALPVLSEPSAAANQPTFRKRRAVGGIHADDALFKLFRVY